MTQDLFEAEIVGISEALTDIRDDLAQALRTISERISHLEAQAAPEPTMADMKRAYRELHPFAPPACEHWWVIDRVQVVDADLERGWGCVMQCSKCSEARYAGFQLLSSTAQKG